MTTFTSTLPDSLLQLLDKKAKELAMPKNKIIEKALSIYLEHLNKADYIKSFKKMAKDPVLRCAMGKSSRQLVLSHFDFQKNLQDKTRIWNEINGN